MAWLRTKRDVDKEKMDKRNTVVADLDEGLKLYSEIAKGWLVKGIKHPLISMIKDSELNLNFLLTPINPMTGEHENRLMKAKVRLKGMLKGILDLSTSELVPMPLVSFLGSLVKKGQYIPDGFLS
jgi:hypothetical protein